MIDTPSAVLYNLYIIDSVYNVHDCGYACEIGSEYRGLINYADDIILINGSLVKIQFMLNICYNYGYQYDIVFNSMKVQFICFGSEWDRDQCNNGYYYFVETVELFLCTGML